MSEPIRYAAKKELLQRAESLFKIPQFRIESAAMPQGVKPAIVTDDGNVIAWFKFKHDAEKFLQILQDGMRVEVSLNALVEVCRDHVMTANVLRDATAKAQAELSRTRLK